MVSNSKLSLIHRAGRPREEAESKAICWKLEEGGPDHPEVNMKGGGPREPPPLAVIPLEAEEKGEISRLLILPPLSSSVSAPVSRDYPRARGKPSMKQREFPVLRVET